MPELCPFVDNLVETVLKNFEIGICADKIGISDIRSGSSLVDNDTPCSDRFKVALPYAGYHVTLEVVFNCCYPSDPPELILGFNDDQDFCPDIQDLQNYCSWDHKDERMLLLTLQELLREFSKYHLSLLSGSRLEFEYNELVDQCCQSEDIEVYVAKRNTNFSGPVRFLIRLRVDFSEIPSYLLKEDGSHDKALLLVTYQNLDGGSVSPQIVFTSRLERILNMSGGVRTLPFPCDGCLTDYVPAVKEHLEKVIKNMRRSFEKRKEYISSFLAYLGSRVIEFDAVAYNKLVCIFEWQDFRFLVTIELNLQFPNEQPTFTFQSVYHTNSDRSTPYSTSINRYPYSPRWNCREMVERAKAFIWDYVGGFQMKSMKEGFS